MASTGSDNNAGPVKKKKKVYCHFKSAWKSQEFTVTVGGAENMVFLASRCTCGRCYYDAHRLLCARLCMYMRMRLDHCSIRSTKQDLYYTAWVSIGKRDEANRIGRIPLKLGYLDSEGLVVLCLFYFPWYHPEKVMPQYFPKSFQFIVRTCSFNFKVFSLQLWPVHTRSVGCCLDSAISFLYSSSAEWICLSKLQFFSAFSALEFISFRMRPTDWSPRMTTLVLSTAVLVLHTIDQNSDLGKGPSTIVVLRRMWGDGLAHTKTLMDLSPISIVGQEFCPVPHRWWKLKNCFHENDTWPSYHEPSITAWGRLVFCL